MTNNSPTVAASSNINQRLCRKLYACIAIVAIMVCVGLKAYLASKNRKTLLELFSFMEGLNHRDNLNQVGFHNQTASWKTTCRELEYMMRQHRNEANLELNDIWFYGDSYYELLDIYNFRWNIWFALCGCGYGKTRYHMSHNLPFLDREAGFRDRTGTISMFWETFNQAYDDQVKHNMDNGTSANDVDDDTALSAVVDFMKTLQEYDGAWGGVKLHSMKEVKFRLEILSLLNFNETRKANYIHPTP